jgi:hypothetical protein
VHSDRMANIWKPVQNLATFNVSKPLRIRACRYFHGAQLFPENQELYSIMTGPNVYGRKTQ